MVITLDFESNNPGSNPGRTSLLFLPFQVLTKAVRGNKKQNKKKNVPVAQWIRRETTNLEIAGSNPVGNVFFFQVFPLCLILMNKQRE